MMRTVLILSPYFPPSSLAGVHRARILAKGLPASGWTPVIVRANPRHYTEPGDSELARLVSAEIEQVVTGAIPATWTRRFGVGDIGLRGYQHFARALKSRARHGADAVLITGSPFYPFLLSRFVRERLKLPVVLDFQDPWVSAEGSRRPALSKAGLAHRLATILEPRAVRYASFITSVSENQNAEMAARYPFLKPAHMAAIPIGGDVEDFIALRQNPPVSVSHVLGSGWINISYVGTLLPQAGVTMRVVLRALARIRKESPTLAAQIRLNFVGTSNQPGAVSEGPMAALARAEGVADLVIETARRVPYLEALSLLARSTAILMVGSDEPHYTASKIYPGLMSGTPYLSLFHAASSSHAILSAAGGGAAFAFSDASELAALEVPIADALVRLATKPTSFSPANSATYLRYTTRGVAAAFADVLNKSLDRKSL